MWLTGHKIPITTTNYPSLLRQMCDFVTESAVSLCRSEIDKGYLLLLFCVTSMALEENPRSDSCC